MYKIQYSKYIEKDLSKLPKNEIKKILLKIEELSEDPRPNGVKALQGNFKGLYRIRSGNYRVVYQIKDDVLEILVVRIAHRGQIYE